jgi:hypothetical protein
MFKVESTTTGIDDNTKEKKLTKAQREKLEQEARMIEPIRAQLSYYAPGRWALEVNYGPSCICGLRTNRNGARPKCYRHPFMHLFTPAGVVSV